MKESKAKKERIYDGIVVGNFLGRDAFASVKY